jgi:hypothetical protein
MLEWLRKRSLPLRATVYAATAILAFALAAGAGAMAALVIQGDLSLPVREDRPVGEQGDTPQHREEGADQANKGQVAAEATRADEQRNAPRQEQKTTADQQEETASKQDKAAYVAKVGALQGNAVEISLDSHDKLLRYDILTTDDVEELQANEAALMTYAKQIDDLDPPQEYEDQYGAFRSAIDGLHAAAQLAHNLVADPTAATKSKFDEYDRRIDEANDRLQESNESLGRDYETLGDVREISPL